MTVKKNLPTKQEEAVVGSQRRPSCSALAMPASGAAKSDREIAVVANHVTSRFGAKPSAITADRLGLLVRHNDLLQGPNSH